MEPAFVVIAILILILVFGVWFYRQRSEHSRAQLAMVRRERDEARRDLKALDAHWDIVTRNISEGVVLIDQNEKILFLNDAAAELFDAAGKVGQSFRDPARQFQIQRLVQDVITRRADALTQTVVKDPRVFQVNVRAAPADATFAAAIFFREITELQRLGKMRRDFMANISHELRTPVTSLSLLAETLATELPRNPSVALNFLTKLREQTDVLRQLTNEMMDLALIESGQLPIQLVETSVNELIAHVVELLRPQADRKQIAFELQAAGELRVLTDSNGIHKALSNLIHNAIKFSPAGETISVRAQRVDDFVEFQVSDQGIGIPARDLPRIFERFYRVDRARMPGETRGTGLGLAITKHIIEGHGGAIRVTSVEGKGSTFYFTLPLAN